MKCLKGKRMDDKYFELTDELYEGEEGSIQLCFKKAIDFIRILESEGYAVLITGGDFKDEWHISWIYAGDGKDHNYARRSEIVFGRREDLDILTDHVHEMIGDK